MSTTTQHFGEGNISNDKSVNSKRREITADEEHLPRAIHALLIECGGTWEGTATALAEELSLGTIKIPWLYRGV